MPVPWRPLSRGQRSPPGDLAALFVGARSAGASAARPGTSLPGVEPAAAATFARKCAHKVDYRAKIPYAAVVFRPADWPRPADPAERRGISMSPARARSEVPHGCSPRWW